MDTIDLYCPSCGRGYLFADTLNARCPVHGGLLTIDTEVIVRRRKWSKQRRTKINPNTRRKVYERDGFACVRCGENDPDELSLDHIVKREHGGGNVEANLRTMCKYCNSTRDRWDRS